MEAYKPRASPMSPGHYLIGALTWVYRENGQLYRSRVGSLLYLATNSGPDLCLAAITLESYVAGPTDDHMKGVKWTLRYSKCTTNTGLLLQSGENVELNASIDANWSGVAHEKRRSRNDILIWYGNAVVYAVSSLQKWDLPSLTEAKEVARSEGCKIIAWLRQVMSELDCPQGPTLVYQDNNGAIEWATGGLAKRFSRKKRVDVGYHYVLKMVSRKKFSWKK